MAALEDWKREIAEDEDDEVVDEYTPVTEAVIYLIESTDTMVSPDAPETAVPDTTQRTKLNWIGRPSKSKLELTLRCALALMRRKIISAPKDKVAVVIYNTEQSKSKDEYSNIYIVQDLLRPTAESIKALKELLEDVESDPSLLVKLFRPHTSQSNLADALSCASSLFRTKAALAHMVKTLVLVTDNDDPVHVDHLTAVETRRKDLYASGYDLHPVFINARPGQEFDLERFWDGFVRKIIDDNDDIDVELPPTQVSSDLDAALMAMQEAMHSREAMKRSAFKIPFYLTKELVIGVQGYALVGEEKKRLPIKYNPNSAEGYEVIRQVSYKDELLDDAEELDPDLIKKYIAVGKAEVGAPPIRIFLSDEDMRKLKTVGMTPCLKLLGFKSRKENLKFQESVKHSYFLQPNEEAFSGSRRTFIALLESMIKKEVIGYAVLLARKSARPQICILIPQMEQLDRTGHQDRAAGLHVIQLPFADDIREIGITSTISAVVRPTREQELAGEQPDQPGIDAAKKIGKHLLKDFNPEAYPNPALNYHYETLAALALNEPIPDPIDKTLPAYATIEARAGQYIHELRQIFQEDEYDPSQVETSKKKRPTAGGGGEVAVGDLDEIKEFARDVAERGIKAMKNDELKSGLKLLNERVSGTKQVLYDRAVQALKEKGFWENGAGGAAGDGSDDDEFSALRSKKDKSKSKKRAVLMDVDGDSE